MCHTVDQVLINAYHPGWGRVSVTRILLEEEGQVSVSDRHINNKVVTGIYIRQVHY